MKYWNVDIKAKKIIYSFINFPVKKSFAHSSRCGIKFPEGNPI